jgi:hypothetical protein
MVAAILFRLPLVLMPLVSAPTATPTPQCQLEVLTPLALEERALAQFTTGIDRYVALHRRLERSLAPEHLFADPEDMFEARAALASALRDARPLARRGTIFTPGVAQLFRDRLETTIRRHTLDVHLAIAETWLDDELEPEVHATLPWRFPADLWPPIDRWPALRASLPVLPAELEYRFAGRSLLLIDVHANMVVDVLDAALPAF